MLKVCRARGPTACSKTLATEGVFEKLEKKSMTGPGWPRTCSHPIYARTLTGVYRVVRMFSACYFHVIISIGILESNSSLSTPVEPNGH